MDFTAYYGYIVVIAMAIYMAVGYYYKGLKQGESFSITKCLETVVLVVLLAATGLMSGVVVTAEWISNLLGTLGQNPATLTAIIAALIGLIDQFVKGGGRIITGGASESIVTEQTKASLPASAEPVAEKTSGQVDVGQFKVFVPYTDVGIDPSKYPVGSLDWQHACTNVIDAEAGYSALATATGKPTPPNPLEVASLRAASALATYQGLSGKGVQNIKDNLAAVNK